MRPREGDRSRDLIGSGASPNPVEPGRLSPPTEGASAGNPLFEEAFWYPRIRTVLTVAQALGRPLSRGELLDLLPRAPPAEREGFLDRMLGALSPGPDGSVPGIQRETVADLGARQERTRTRLREATEFVEGLPPFFQACLRLAAVTGSTAYGNPAPEDDIDLFLVTREGSLWIFLLGAFLYLRTRRWKSSARTAPEYCLNFALEERVLPAEFTEPQGFLFARETLMMRPVRGDGLLRAVLTEAPWLQREIPGLYTRRLQELSPSSPTTRPLGWTVRIANGVVFPWLAAYLHGKRLLKNYDHRRRGRPDSTFRLETTLHRLAVRSRKYDRLIALYGSGIETPGGSGPSGHGRAPGEAGPRGPTAEPGLLGRSTPGGPSPDERSRSAPSGGSETPASDP